MTLRIDSVRDLPQSIIDRNPALKELAGNTPAQKKTKYNSVATMVGEIRFDSKREAARYCELLLLKRAGVVKEIELQPRFLLQPAFIDGISGRFVKKMEYVADFRVTYDDGHVEVEDVKSPATKTKTYLIKRKLFRNKYPDVIFQEVE